MCLKCPILRICISASILTWLALWAGAFIDTRGLKLKEIPREPIVAFANAPTNAYQETGLSYRTTINKDTIIHFLTKGKRAGIEAGYDPKADRSVIPTAGVFVLTNGQIFFWRLWTRTLTIENTNCEIATLVLDKEDKFEIPEDPKSNEPKKVVEAPTLRPDDILYFVPGSCLRIRFASDRLSRPEFDRFLKAARVDNTMSKHPLRNRLNGTPPLDFGVAVTKDFQIVYWTSWSKEIVEIRTEHDKSVFLVAE
jgi:hypothetical protein